jgi:ubiquinone/menaquinone biosynthesis C-methylase UbiE
MKIGAVAQNPLEWVAIQSGQLPLPLLHTQLAFVLSKAVMDAFELQVFEAAKDKPMTLEALAKATQLDARALKSLLNVLMGAGYFSYDNGSYSLTKMARKWCLKDSPQSLYNQQIFNQVCWPWMDEMKNFLKTGKGLQYHDTFGPEEWDLYQKGMASVSLETAKLTTKAAPKLSNPTAMLDIGGSHGLFSLAFVNQYPGMKATILDLPQAVEKAKPILAQHYKGDAIQYWPGNALTDDYGDAKYDVVLMSSLMHHFSKEQNEEVSRKVARALKPGGYFLIHEFLRPNPKKNMDMIGAILDLFFNLSSTSGNWSKEELIGFQTQAGLKHVKVKSFLTLPGYVQVAGQK